VNGNCDCSVLTRDLLDSPVSFIPIKQSEAERLYFMLEGKPFVIENKSDTTKVSCN
jgi:hypothetical protein